MTDVLQLVQDTLDGVLSVDKVRVYWGKRGEIDATAKKDEYVIYSQDNDSISVSADGAVIARTASISIRLYIDQATCRTYQGRLAYKMRAETILHAMIDAGFECPNGWVEIGDIDDIGFAVFLAVFDYARVEYV